MDKSDFDNFGNVYSKGGLYVLSWLILLELVAIFVFAPPQFVREAIVKDLQSSKVVLGEKLYERNKKNADEWYRKHILNSGLKDAVYSFFLPTDEERRRSKGLEHLDKGWWDRYIGTRVETLFYLIYMIVYRLFALGQWLPLAGVLLVPAILDGYYAWKKKQTNFDYSSPIIQTYAVRVASLITIGFIVLLFLPISINQLIIPAGATLLVLMVGTIMANMPKRF